MSLASEKKQPLKRNENINIRVEGSQRDRIDQAARAVGKSRTEFILDAVSRKVEEVENTLLDKVVFVLSEDEWKAFHAALDAPVSSHENLRKLFATKSPWD